MVRRSTRTSLVIVLILFVVFNILSMVEGRRHQVQRHQCQNNHESHHHCPNPKHHTETHRKKRSDLSTMTPILLNKNHTFDIFYDNLKFHNRDIPYSRSIYHEKPWNSESKRENYLKNLEKIFGRFPQHMNVRNIKKSSEPTRKLKSKFLKNENIQQILNNLEEEESPNHIRVKRRAHSKSNQVSSPTAVSSEYLRSLAESFPEPSEAEEIQDIDTKEIEDDQKKIQHLGGTRKRNIHQIPTMNKIKPRLKRFEDFEEKIIQNHNKNHRNKKEIIHHRSYNSKNKKVHTESLKPDFIKREVKSLDKKVIKKKQNKKEEKKMTEKKSISEKKNKSLGVGKNLQHKKNSKRGLEKMKNLKKNKNRIDRLRKKRGHSIKETNDLYGSLKSSSSLEEIKNLAENLISKIDHLEESFKRHRMERNSHELSSDVHSKDNSIS